MTFAPAEQILSAVRAVLRHRRIGTTAGVIAVRAIVLAANVGTGVLTAAMLGPAGRGVQAALMVGPQMVGGLAQFGLHGSLIYNIKAAPLLERKLVGGALLLAALTGLLGMLISWVLVPLWLAKYDPATVSAARWLLTLVVPGVITSILMGALEAHGRFSLANRLTLVMCLATLAGLCLLWMFGRVTPVTTAAAYLLPTVPVCFAMLWREQAVSKPEFSFDIGLFKRLLHFGLRFYGTELLTALGGYMDQFVLVLMLDPSLVGIYVVAQSASRVLSVIPTSVVTVLFPTVAARSPSNVVDIVGLTARITTLVTVMAALVFGALGPFLLHLLYGPRFGEAIGSFRILLAETVLTNLGRILYQVFSAVGRPEIVTILEAGGTAVSAVSMLLLVPHFGAVGAALGLLISAVARLACVLIGLPLFLGVRAPRLMVSRADIARAIGH